MQGNGTLGTFGILSATFLGGLVFDAFGPGAPFTMMSLVNLLVFVWALLVILSGRSKSQQSH